MYRVISTVAMLLLGCLGASTAWAACTHSGTTDGLDYFKVALSGFAPVAFDPENFAVGQVIARGSYLPRVVVNSPNPISTSTVKCTEKWRPYAMGVNMGTPIVTNGSDRVYPTHINGVGLSFNINNWAEDLPLLYPQDTAANSSVALAEKWGLTVELVKIGDITAGGVLTGPVVEYRQQSAVGQLLAEFSWASPVVITPIVPTCAVGTPNITVSLGNVSVHSLKGVGSTSQAKDFGIHLSCSGGATGTYTNVHVTLTDVTQPGNTSTVLSLSPESTATGVGIQIMNNGIVRGYGPDSSEKGNLNQWRGGAVSAGTGSYEIPLSAQYVQTSETVTVGTANARATFTMSYQ